MSTTLEKIMEEEKPWLTEWAPRRSLLADVLDMFDPLMTTSRESFFVPRVDILEKEGNLIVRCDLPGQKLEDIKIRCEMGELIITGERRSTASVDKAGVLRRESRYGRFERTLALPRDIVEDKIIATYGQGVLEIVLPRSRQDKHDHKEIAIKAI